MPRAKDERPLPQHTSIVRGPYLGRYYEKSRMLVELRCPLCEEVRERPASEVRKEMLRPNFKGLCRSCALKAVSDGTHRWLNYRSSKPAYANHNGGYVRVSPSACSDDLLPIYRQMQKSGQPVLEHRLRMAQHLGRALTSNEMVDHMNGDKTDNRIENLRLYVRGKQQPGSCPGHGTYYHEWQMALARVRELEGSPLDII